MTNIIDLSLIVASKVTQQQEDFAHLDRKCAMHRILAEAITEMRKVTDGKEDSASIAQTLRFAAGELEPDECEGDDAPDGAA
jgi:hypothetical protein